MRPLLALITFTLASCAAPEPASLCSPPSGWEDTLSAPAVRYPGLDPETFTEIVCATSESVSPAHVVLDWPVSADLALQTAWAAPTNRFLSTLTREWPAWKTLDDGRTDVAVIAMTEKLHEMKAAGLPISIEASGGGTFAANPDQQSFVFGVPPVMITPVLETYAQTEDGFKLITTE